MAAPFEIVASPYDVYVAPTGTAFPDLDEAPAVDWKRLGGTAGAKNVTEDGVTVTLSQEFEQFRGAGSTGVRKVTRTTEDLMIALTVVDTTAEMIMEALNSVAPTVVTPGVSIPGSKDLPLLRGPAVNLVSLLVRGVSPYGDLFVAQYQVPAVYQSESPELQYSKGVFTGILLTFTAIEDPAGGANPFGLLRLQNAAAT